MQKKKKRYFASTKRPVTAHFHFNVQRLVLNIIMNMITIININVTFNTAMNVVKNMTGEYDV